MANETDSGGIRGWLGADLVYGVLLFGAMVGTLIFVGEQQWLGSSPSLDSADANYWAAAGFLLIILITISMGFPHPQAKDLSNIGHVSFDRLAQIASILVLGPILAAVINGIASFVYPLHRLVKGQSFRKVAMSMFFNSGLMMLCVLISGWLYWWLGGTIPLLGIQLGTIVPLVAMILCFEIVHELAMQSMVYVRGGDRRQHFNGFSILINISTALGGVLLAVIFNGADRWLFCLLLVLLVLMMIALNQLASMRLELEDIVTHRTQQLQLRTEELLHQANHDALTTLYNRRYISSYLDEQVKLAQFEQEPLSICVIDIDHFKSVNDDYSHATGDDVLRQLATILSDNCRPSDSPSRYGGEEFLIVLPKTTRSIAESEAERLRQLIAQYPWKKVLPRRKITVSVGVADLASTHSAKRILDQADKCLYIAKHQGRNQVIASAQ